MISKRNGRVSKSYFQEKDVIKLLKPLSMPKIHLIILFLLLSAGWTFAQAQDPPRITLDYAEISVGELLEEISRQSGIHFSYSTQSIDPTKKIAFQVDGLSLNQTLDQLAEIIPLEYSLVENQIVLHRPEVFHTISGYVSDRQSGESLIGASVFVEGTTQGNHYQCFWILFSAPARRGAPTGLLLSGLRSGENTPAFAKG